MLKKDFAKLSLNLGLLIVDLGEYISVCRVNHQRGVPRQCFSGCVSQLFSGHKQVTKSTLPSTSWEQPCPPTLASVILTNSPPSAPAGQSCCQE